MGDVSGYWLTWYYFGYSRAYGTVIALVQVIGGTLLTFRRTALFAALTLVPVFVNILPIDVFFRIAIGATLAALLVLACLGAVIAPHLERLREAVLLPTDSHRMRPRIAGLCALLLVAWSVTWVGVHYVKRQPTIIDGGWSIASSTKPPGVPSAWREAFFERNRAHAVVFRSAAGDTVHHFDVSADGTIRVWETWGTKGPPIMEGRLLSTDQLELREVREQQTQMILTRQHWPRS